MVSLKVPWDIVVILTMVHGRIVGITTLTSLPIWSHMMKSVSLMICSFSEILQAITILRSSVLLWIGLK